MIRMLGILGSSALSPEVAVTETGVTETVVSCSSGWPLLVCVAIIERKHKLLTILLLIINIICSECVFCRSDKLYKFIRNNRLLLTI